MYLYKLKKNNGRLYGVQLLKRPLTTEAIYFYAVSTLTNKSVPRNLFVYQNKITIHKIKAIRKRTFSYIGRLRIV